MVIKNCVILLLTFVISSLCQQAEISVIHDSKADKYEIVKGVAVDAIAVALFNNNINKTGWAELEVYTNATAPDTLQAYAAGLLEGFITQRLMTWHWKNTIGNFCAPPYSTYCGKLKTYLEKNLKWVISQIHTYAKTDPYWHQVELFLVQLNGLEDGYANKTGKPRFTVDYIFGVYLFQIQGDLEDLESALKGASNDRLSGTFGHCSALIKLLPGNKDLYVAQDTWSDVESMLRILKKYHFNFHSLEGGNLVPGTVATFSSYPGVLYSADDFYILSQGLVTQETTIGNSNSSLWKYITPENSVLEGVRNVVANRLARNADEWAQIFSTHNSGTYNNQWMIVDYNKFDPGQTYLQDGLFVVLEQIPGKIEWHDQTQLLQKQTYFPSYNIAFYKDIYNMSGNIPLAKKYGDWFTYDKNPRALIFKRDHQSVKDTDSMTKLMRYNNYTHDPLSKCNCTPPYSAENAISARDDLNPIKGKYPFGALGHRPHVGFDMKLTTYKMAKDLEFIAVSSPTFDDLPPFQWSKSDYNTKLSHIGHPDLWNFTPIHVKWSKHYL